MRPFGILLLLCCTATFAITEPTARYLELTKEMQNLVDKTPDLVQRFSIGENDEGVPIYALRISTEPSKPTPNKLGYLLVAAHHGNEATTPDLALSFARSLIERFQGPSLYTTRVADTEWIIVPVLNISGINAHTRQEYQRDSNRDYPGPCESRYKGRLASTRAMLKLLEERAFVASATIHGFTGTLTFPWGVHTEDPLSRDDAEYRRIVGEAAAENGYAYGTSTQVVYAANGSFEDFVYWKYGIWSLLVELRDGSASDLQKTTEALHRYFELVDRQPSTKHDLAGDCLRGGPPDLGIE